MRSKHVWRTLVAAALTASGCASILDVDGTWTLDPGDSGAGGFAGTSSSSEGGGIPTFPCDPTHPICKQIPSDCLALEDNSVKTTFMLRIASLALSVPKALTTGIVDSVIDNAVQMNLASCNLGGAGTFSWLILLDTSNQQLITGASLPVPDPTKGYSFLVTTLAGLPIAPNGVDAAIELGGGAFSNPVGADVNLPIFLDSDGKSSLVLPLRNVTFSGHIDADNNCIGTYNAAGLDPSNNCIGDETTPTFIHGAQVEAFIPLEDADTVDIESLGQSLCVLLSGDASTFGDSSKPTKRCKRDPEGKIVFKGDWCTETHQAATPSCADALQLQGTFAASAVKSF